MALDIVGTVEAVAAVLVAPRRKRRILRFLRADFRSLCKISPFFSSFMFLR